MFEAIDLVAPSFIDLGKLEMADNVRKQHILLLILLVL